MYDLQPRHELEMLKHFAIEPSWLPYPVWLVKCWLRILPCRVGIHQWEVVDQEQSYYGQSPIEYCDLCGKEQ